MSPRCLSLMKLLLAALLFCGALGNRAQARVFIGFGGPFYYGPPVYMPPPAYYPPYYASPYYPPDNTFSYTPPQAEPRRATPARIHARSCRAGPYSCPLVDPAIRGAPCDCTGHDGRPVPGRAK